MTVPLPISRSSGRAAFTLVEMLVTVSVMVLLVVMITQLLNSASAVTLQGQKHMDADEQARAVFDRMANDFAGLVKRQDVDYGLKTTGSSQGVNDQMAFYSQVVGYYPPTIATTAQSPISLVAYRINGDNQLQRYGCGLPWNGASTSGTSMIFTTSPFSTGANTIALNWPAAVSATAYDPNYELIGPQVFRFAYYYILKGNSLNPPTPSNTPWDVRLLHASINGLQDVAAIVAVIAVIDPKSQKLITSPQQLQTLAQNMPAYSGTSQPGFLEDQWQTYVNGTANGLPRVVASAIAVYQRVFYLTPIP